MAETSPEIVERKSGRLGKLLIRLAGGGAVLAGLGIGSLTLGVSGHLQNTSDLRTALKLTAIDFTNTISGNDQNKAIFLQNALDRWTEGLPIDLIDIAEVMVDGSAESITEVRDKWEKADYINFLTDNTHQKIEAIRDNYDEETSYGEIQNENYGCNLGTQCHEVFSDSLISSGLDPMINQFVSENNLESRKHLEFLLYRNALGILFPDIMQTYQEGLSMNNITRGVATTEDVEKLKDFINNIEYETLSKIIISSQNILSILKDNEGEVTTFHELITKLFYDSNDTISDRLSSITKRVNNNSGMSELWINEFNDKSSFFGEIFAAFESTDVSELSDYQLYKTITNILEFYTIPTDGLKLAIDLINNGYFKNSSSNKLLPLGISYFAQNYRVFAPDNQLVIELFNSYDMNKDALDLFFEISLNYDPSQPFNFENQFQLAVDTINQYKERLKVLGIREDDYASISTLDILQYATNIDVDKTLIFTQKMVETFRNIDPGYIFQLITELQFDGLGLLSYDDISKAISQIIEYPSITNNKILATNLRINIIHADTVTSTATINWDRYSDYLLILDNYLNRYGLESYADPYLLVDNSQLELGEYLNLYNVEDWAEKVMPSSSTLVHNETGELIAVAWDVEESTVQLTTKDNTIQDPFDYLDEDSPSAVMPMLFTSPQDNLITFDQSDPSSLDLLDSLSDEEFISEAWRPERHFLVIDEDNQSVRLLQIKDLGTDKSTVIANLLRYPRGWTVNPVFYNNTFLDSSTNNTVASMEEIARFVYIITNTGQMKIVYIPANVSAEDVYNSMGGSSSNITAIIGSDIAVTSVMHVPGDSGNENFIINPSSNGIQYARMNLEN